MTGNAARAQWLAAWQSLSASLCLLLVAVLLPVPALAQLFTDTESRKAIAAQRETIAAQQDQIAELIRRNELLSGRINQVENALKAQSLLELLNQVEALQAEVRKLRGQQEVLTNSIDAAVRRQRDMYVDLDSRLKRLEAPTASTGPGVGAAVGATGASAAAASPAGAGAVLAAAPATAPAAPAVPVPAIAANAAGAGPIVVPPAAAGPMAAAASPAAGQVGTALTGANTAAAAATATAATITAAAATAAPATSAAAAADAAAEQRAYDAAHQLRRIGNFAGAITAFQAFNKTWPKSRLAPAAQYWIGDSHFNLREFKGAIAAQRQLISTSPDSDKVPDAWLNIASALSELGDNAASRKTLEELVARFPSSDAAERAKRRLAVRK